ncbi:AfsR/SARP family transcriptional regulator [Streptomyces justiciae]|uniref:AfsR/SARP family transcriptional regulator n=1 Tax=Streptomyces justiciae TaxID=2780140 RepID=UPI002118CF4E|nr:bacterial transcriptional activator domain-containing protein [Streptomyces justiciae]MCW8384529.1 bacterial transcriptional activator domain-containing protein [Streptomyces justiciae]
MSLYSLLGAAALLAAAALALALRRTRRHPMAGRKTAMGTKAAQPTDAPTAAGEADRPAGIVLLDAALRTMAHHNAHLPEPASLPAVRGVRIGTTTLRLLPDDPATEPPAPFTAGRDDHWGLPDDADLLDTDTAARVPAPYPALVTLGTTSDGELLLLNLAALPALLLDGEPAHVHEVCTALAVELATSPWANGLELITVSCGDGLDHLLPATTITPLPDSAQAVREATERLLEAHQAPDASQHPLIVLCADPLTVDAAWQFADLATRPLTLIAPADTTAPHLPDAPVLDTAANRAQYLEYLDTWVTLQRLTPAAYQEITDALRGAAAHPLRTDHHNSGQGTVQDVSRAPGQGKQPSTADPTTPDTSSETSSPNATTTREDSSDSGSLFPALLSALHSVTSDPAHPAEDPSAGTPPGQGIASQQTGGSVAQPGSDADPSSTRSAPQIRVLGPVEVDGVDAGGHGPRIAQLAALIYFKPGRTAEALCTDMDPAHPWSTTTLNARLHGLRAALGNDPTGRPYVPRRKSGDDPYHLNPTVTCDWTRFQHLTHDALSDEGTDVPHVERLEEALALVRGTPFDGKPLPWAAPLLQEMTTAITQVAHTIATHRMNPGPDHDLDRARRAIARGIDIDETAEVLYRDWILVEQAAGNRHGVQTAISRVQHINRALNSPLEKETEQLIDSLLGPAGHT